MSSPVANGPNFSEQLMQNAGLMAKHSWIKYGLGIACLALILSVSGAYNTDDLSLTHRLFLWFVVSGLIVGQAVAIDEFMLKILPGHFGMRLLGALLALGLTIVFVAVELHALKYTPLLPKKPDPPMAFLAFVSLPVIPTAGYVLVSRLQLPLRRQLAHGFGMDSTVVHRIAETPLIAGLLPPPEAFLPKLIDWPIAPVMTVKSDDHYLEVSTECGRVYVRGRMSDAIANLYTQNGMQVHRSWWVAEQAVEGVEREGRDYTLLLSSGTRVPVGRSRVKHLQEAGWIV